MTSKAATIETLLYDAIVNAMTEAEGDLTKAAKALGISNRELFLRLTEFRLKALILS